MAAEQLLGRACENEAENARRMRAGLEPVSQEQSSGPTSNSSKAGIVSHRLSGVEVSAVRQLITGYRESAAFLLRSAEELESLLALQHQTTVNTV